MKGKNKGIYRETAEGAKMKPKKIITPVGAIISGSKIPWR